MALSAAAANEAITSAGALDRLLDATRPGMERVNAMILDKASSHVALVPEVARYLIDAGGKRLRPMLTIAASMLFGNANGSEVNFAAAVEFMHNATLLHDDVVDESNMRRGRAAARMLWGNQASVLVGDFLLGQAFMMMVDTGNVAALKVISQAATVIAEGEVLQLAKTRDLSTSSADYDEVIGAKTATLFEAATEVGAMAGGADAAGRRALKDYGRELGFAFQLVDDVLDYRGESGTLGKNTGDDLREGKMTLPVILALRQATPAEHETIIGSLGNIGTGEAELKQVVAIFERYDTLGKTIAEAGTHAIRARDALKPLPPSEMKTLLGDIADFTVARAY
ncbi:polyprenyl synthetase family protein [Devosia sp. ZB163]|uniref:polyprenyl synthetase family protein n=1 Tax=Devosia sp. ZB163 TaxID=3025938 RepID=UPI00235E9687|nr:polyprenyl synthetase family protein [Devosia sp. ZB163]MDC9823673.1 polyprenyl synthetase family protein [Devosia sp. ZB163]